MICVYGTLNPQNSFSLNSSVIQYYIDRMVFSPEDCFVMNLVIMGVASQSIKLFCSLVSNQRTKQGFFQE